jgi:hypothetical protein
LLHIFLHTENVLITYGLFFHRKTLGLLAFQAADAGPNGRRPAATRSRPIELPISHILTVCGEVAERLKAAVC